MNSFHKENRDHIKAIFQERTGVELTRRRWAGRAVRVAAVAAAVLACCTVTALAANRLFSSLDGDDLALSAVYEGMESSPSRWKTGSRQGASLPEGPEADALDDRGGDRACLR